MTTAYAKGILQPDGTRCYSGPECSRHGAFNRAVVAAVSDTMEDFVQGAMEEFMAKRDFVQANGVTPQEFATLSEGASQFGNWYGDEVAANPDKFRYAELPVDYTPTMVDEPSGNYYGRYGRVAGGKVDMPVDLEALAQHLYEPKSEVAKRAAIAFLREEGFGNSDAYEIGGHSDYYSERPYIKLEDEYQTKAEAFFRQFPNAQDPTGLYDRARAYGVETKNTPPQQAFLSGLQKKYGAKLPKELREQLAKDASAPYWVRKTTVEVTGHGPGVITVDQQALASTSEAKALPAKKEVAGVLLARAGNTSAYRLLEGVGNYKALLGAPGTNASKSRPWLTVIMPPA